jgi:hypothetical protein
MEPPFLRSIPTTAERETSHMLFAPPSNASSSLFAIQTYLDEELSRPLLCRVAFRTDLLPAQFSEGFATCSMTITPAAPFAGSSFNPSSS